MARNYGRVATSIWRDPDFLNLSSDARFTYVMLFSQPKISAVGVLEVTERRWMSALGFVPTQLAYALYELSEHAYVVVDESTEELFVRSFVRSDGGANNDLRQKAIRAAALSVVSDQIRASIALELDRLSLPHDLSKAPRSPIEGRRVVAELGESIPDPGSSIQDPGAVAAVADDPSSDFCPEHQPFGTTEPCGPCGTRAKGNRARRAATLADEIAAKQARQAAIDACDHCDDAGKRVAPGTARVVARFCNHQTEQDAP